MTAYTQELLKLCADAEGCDLFKIMCVYANNEEFKRRIDLIALHFTCPIDAETIH